MRKQLLLFLLGVFFFAGNVSAQEINARVTINSDKIAGSDKRVYETLQNALTEFINGKQWTDATFSVNERIECTITLIINEVEDKNFKGEIQVQARRPVYNSSYTTTLLNFRDRQFEFEYTEYEPLEYMENTLTNNLTAVVTFYVYLILGLDFDSFSPLGGNAFIQQAQQIVSMAQSQMGWIGWKAFDSNQNRHAVITALTDNTLEDFRQMWYTYHRRGLDEMAANPDRGRTNIITALQTLQQIKSARPTSVILQMFADSKLDEIVAVYSKATSQEKQDGFKLLSTIYLTESTRLEPLKR